MTGRVDAYLHLQSEFSLLDGTAPVETLCDRARAAGLHAVALADTDNAYGHVRFFKAARERGLKPILGVRVTDPAGAGDAVCLAKDGESYANLCRLISARQLKDGFRLADALPGLCAGLVVLTRHASLLERLAPRVERARLFAELVSWRGETHRALLAAARNVGVAPVASPEVRFLDPADWEAHRVLCAIRESELVSRLRPAQVASPAASFPDPAAFRHRFAGIPEALANAAAIAAACEAGLELGVTRFPRFPLPFGASDHRSYLTSRCEAGLRRRYRPQPPEVARSRLAYELDVIGDLGFAEYFLVVWDVVRFCQMKRIPCVGRGSAASSLVSYALGITNVDPLRYNLPFERFLHRSRADVPDIDLDLCWRRRDEVLAYVYETHGAERTAMISTHATFQTRLAFREVAKAYGIPNEVVNRLSRGVPYHAVPGEPAERMARLYGRALDSASEYRTPADAPAWGSGWEWHLNVAGAVEGHQDGKAVSFRKRPARDRKAGRSLEPRSPAAPPMQTGGSRLAAAIRRTPECRGFPLDEEPYPTVLRLAERLVGMPRHLGIHSGGMVIGREPLARHVPLERAAKGIVITQPEMDAVEALGFIKMDLLGQRALTTLDDAVRLVRERRGIEVDLERIPDPDPAASALLREGRTLSCFQIESPGMRNLMAMLGVESSDELIAALSLIRPGPAGSGMKERYVRRRRGEEPVVYPHPLLEPLLRDTYGIMLYQEDIMRVAHAIAGFTLEEADRLRRAIEEGRNPLHVNRVAHAFFRRAVSSAIDEGTAWGVWEQMKQFMGYAFCKAHAATYGVLAYQATYLKAHYPAEFYVAVLDNHQGMYPRSAHVEEAKRLGIRFLGPDVQASGGTYELVESGCGVFGDGAPEEIRKGDDLGRPAPGSRGSIRVPLSQVRGLTAATVERILEARAWGSFHSLRELAGRTGASRDEIEALVKSGALDSLGRSRSTLLLQARLLARARAYQIARFAAEGTALAIGGDEHRVPELAPPSREQVVSWELEHLGFTLDEHPLALYRRELPAGVTPASAVERAPTGTRLRTAGIAIASRHHPTEKGEPMVFLTLEDEGGVVETTLFPAAYRRWGHALRDAGPFVAEGTVERHHGVATLTVERLERVRSLSRASLPSRDVDVRGTARPDRAGAAGGP